MRERRLDLIDFIPHEHFHEVDPSGVGLQLVQPGVQLHKSVPFGDVVHCGHKQGEKTFVSMETETCLFSRSLEENVQRCLRSVVSIFTQDDSLSAAVVAGRQGAKSFLSRRILHGQKHSRSRTTQHSCPNQPPNPGCGGLVDFVCHHGNVFQTQSLAQRGSRSGSRNWAQESFIEMCH